MSLPSLALRSQNPMLLLNGAFFFPGGGVLKCSPGFVLGNQGTPDTVLGITCLLLSDWKNQSSEDCHPVFLEKVCSGKLYEAAG